MAFGQLELNAVDPVLSHRPRNLSLGGRTRQAPKRCAYAATIDEDEGVSQFAEDHLNRQAISGRGRGALPEQEIVMTTVSSEKRVARERSARTGEPYQTALWRNRDLRRFQTLYRDLEGEGFNVLTDDDKRALWRDDSVAIDREQEWAFKWMFEKIEACVSGTASTSEQRELAREVPWIFSEESIKQFADIDDLLAGVGPELADSARRLSVGDPDLAAPASE
jgi:hypothetical protein